MRLCLQAYRARHEHANDVRLVNSMSESSKRQQAAGQRQSELLQHCRTSPPRAPPLAACKADGGPPCGKPADHDDTRLEVARKHEQVASQAAKPAANVDRQWPAALVIMRCTACSACWSLTEAVRRCLDDTALVKLRLPGVHGAVRAAILSGNTQLARCCAASK